MKNSKSTNNNNNENDQQISTHNDNINALKYSQFDVSSQFDAIIHSANAILCLQLHVRLQ